MSPAGGKRPAAGRAGGRIRLIVWNEVEAAERAKSLAAGGWMVERSLPPGPVLFRELRQAPPDAAIIDLGRLPSQGRDVALSIRSAAGSRGIPLVFIMGDAEKTARVRELLPDATFTTWKNVEPALRNAIRNAPALPVKPASVFAGYSGTPLPKKLGIKPSMIVSLVGAPKEFRETLGELPPGATVRTGRGSPGPRGGAPRLVMWFVRTTAELSRDLPGIAELAGDAPLWIAWKKKAALGKAASRGSPGEPDVRAAGLTIGLVDFKICAIDTTWSGLLFTRRKRR